MAFIGTIIIATLIILATTLPFKPFNAMELTLFGASISAFCMAITQGLLIYNESAIEELIYWLNGSVANKHINILMIKPTIINGHMYIRILICLFATEPFNQYINSSIADSL